MLQHAKRDVVNVILTRRTREKIVASLVYQVGWRSRVWIDLVQTEHQETLQSSSHRHMAHELPFQAGIHVSSLQKGERASWNNIFTLQHCK